MKREKLRISAAIAVFLLIWVVAVSMTISVREESGGELSVIDTMVTTDGVGLHFQIIEGGSPTILLEASMYPGDIAGIVFIDPFSAEFIDMLGVEYLDNHPMTGRHPFDTSDLSRR